MDVEKINFYILIAAAAAASSYFFELTRLFCYNDINGPYTICILIYFLLFSYIHIILKLNIFIFILKRDIEMANLFYCIFCCYCFTHFIDTIMLSGSSGFIAIPVKYAQVHSWSFAKTVRNLDIQRIHRL